MLGTFLLLHVFPAVLPPKDADSEQDEYYHILGLTASKRSTSADDIRKAYRKLSLELHPDKIAQRGSRAKYTAEEAAALYEKVQEAYSVLHDKKERSKYHSVNCSVARYKFIYQQGWMHPLVILENISKASCWDKFRLVLVAMTVIFCLLLQPILIAAKVNADLSDSDPLNTANWNAILVPFYILYSLFILFQLLIFVVTRQRLYLMEFLQHVCFLVGTILVVREWERDGRPRASAEWNKLSTPFYLAVMFKLAALAERIQSFWQIHDKLVSPEKMTVLVQEQIQKQQQQEPQTSSTRQELNADHVEELLRQTFVVVTPNELSYATSVALLEQTSGESLTDEEVELLKVQSSPEYEHLQEQIGRTTSALLQTMLYGPTLIALIAAKLLDHIDASWWVVFLPVWIYLGWQLLQSCFTCCCLVSAIPHEEEGDDDHDGDAGAGNDNATENDKEPKATEKESDENKAGTDDSKPSSDDPKSSDKPSSDNTNSPDGDGEEGGSNDNQDPLAASSSGVSSRLFEPPTSFDAKNKETSDDDDKADTDANAAEEGRATDDATETKADGEKEGEDDDDDGIDHGDAEEAFRQWQRAHAQAADNAVVEAQARAQATCCSSVFYLITICLIVGKLEDSYDGDEGFNAFWVLFPTFLIAGLLVCCFCCLVYSTPDVAKMEEMIRQNEDTQGVTETQPTNAHDEEEGDPTIIPPAASESGVEVTATSSSHHSDKVTTPLAQPPSTAEEPAAETAMPNDDGNNTNDDDDKIEAPPQSNESAEGEKDGANDATDDINDLD